MSNTLMMERTGVNYPGTTYPGVGTPVNVAAGPNYLMVPRCTYKFENCQGGMKIWCNCDDKTACSMVQNLCTMLQGGLCCCTVSYNGMTVCNYNFTFGMCNCEVTENGVCFTCTSGDSKCCEMIQSYCQCLSTMVNNGCHCCVSINNTPVCYGCCDTTTTTKATKK